MPETMNQEWKSYFKKMSSFKQCNHAWNSKYTNIYGNISKHWSQHSQVGFAVIFTKIMWSINDNEIDRMFYSYIKSTYQSNQYSPDAMYEVYYS